MTLILTSLEIREDSLYAVALDHLEVVDATGVNRGFPKKAVSDHTFYRPVLRMRYIFIGGRHCYRCPPRTYYLFGEAEGMEIVLFSSIRTFFFVNNLTINCSRNVIKLLSVCDMNFKFFLE